MNRSALLAVALLLSAALPVSAQSVSLSLRDGRVTLITQNASPSAILAEWARIGQVKVVDAERIPATPLTLRLENVPEREALDIVLRSAAGYIAAPRAQPLGGAASRFDRVIVMASSPGAATAARPNTGPATAARTGGSPTPFRPQPPQVEEEDGDEQQTVTEEAQAMPVVAEQPVSSTNFDYANPQRYFAARQAEQAAEAAQQQQQQGTPQPSTSPMGSLGQTSVRPGVLPMPQPQQQDGTTQGGATIGNPYGLPAGQAPGSAAGTSPLEPDRSKYINPYSPTPPRP